MQCRYTLRSLVLVASLLAACGGVACSGGGGDGGEEGGLHFAYVTNGVADFWTNAEAGAMAGAEEYGVRVTVLMPAGGITDQKNQIEDLLAKGVDGIAISPIDPVNQVDLIDKACAQTIVITHDSDAPGTKRRCYIGMDNYIAGRMCGELVAEAIPDGGKFAIFIGRLEQDNARRRRQGVIDGALGRSHDASRTDAPDARITSADGRFQLVGTYTDQFDRARGKANVEDALSRHPDLACVVCLFGYNPPLAIEALRGAGKLGEVKIVAFDEDPDTLQGIIDGAVVGTIVQDPFLYGKDSVRVLKGLHQGLELAELGFDADGFLDIPARTIRADNVVEFWAQLKKNLGQE